MGLVLLDVTMIRFLTSEIDYKTQATHGERQIFVCSSCAESKALKIE